jgi:hypothetical protein
LELQFKRPPLSVATGQSAKESEKNSKVPNQIKETFNPLGFGAHTADAGTTAFGIKVMGLVEQNPLGAVGALGAQTGIDLTSSTISPAACVEGKTVARVAGQIGGLNNIFHIMLQGAGMVINPPLAIVAGIAAGTGMSYALFDKTRAEAVKDCYGEPVAITIQLPASVKPQDIVIDPVLQELAPQFSYAGWKLYSNDHNELTVQLGENTLKQLPKWAATHPDFAQKYHMQDWRVSLIMSTEEYDFSNHADENTRLTQDRTQEKDNALASAKELWQAKEVSLTDRFGGR